MTKYGSEFWVGVVCSRWTCYANKSKRRQSEICLEKNLRALEAENLSPRTNRTSLFTGSFPSQSAAEPAQPQHRPPLDPSPAHHHLLSNTHSPHSGYYLHPRPASSALSPQTLFAAVAILEPFASGRGMCGRSWRRR